MPTHKDKPPEQRPTREPEPTTHDNPFALGFFVLIAFLGNCLSFRVLFKAWGMALIPGIIGFAISEPTGYALFFLVFVPAYFLLALGRTTGATRR